MKFAVTGISYQNATIQKREGASFSDTQKLQMYDELLDAGIQQAMILTTCNRSELYFLYEDNVQVDTAVALYLRLANALTHEDIFVKTKRDAFLYLFEVCGGYHSMIPGEDQILGQMKNAYAFANQVGACGKQLHRILQSCFACIKHIKQEYRISEIATSIGYLAYTYLLQHVDLHHKNILLIGSGEMAQLMLNYLKEHETKIWLCSRTFSHAQKLQEEIQELHLLPFAQRYACIPQCDIIISATASPHVILKKANYPMVDKEQYLLDLASPRDIEETLADGKHHLCNLDDLQVMVDEHCQERKKRMSQAYGDIVQEVDALQHWLNHVRVDNAIQSLQKYSSEQAQRTFALLQHKLHLEPHEERVLKKVLETSFQRMVKEPILALKQLEEDEQEPYAKMVEQLFQKEDDVCNIS